MPIEILMPALSPTMEEGNLTKWLVSEGDEVASGDVLAEIETDKATMEIEAVEEGVLAKILVKEGTGGVKVNQPIAILLEEGESAEDIDNIKPKQQNIKSEKTFQKLQKPSALQNNQTENTPEQQVRPAGYEQSGGSRIKASPLAKRIAKDKGLDLAQIKGSGPYGRIIKRDVENAPAGAVIGQTPVSQPTQSTEIGAPRAGGAEILEKQGIAPGSYDFVPLDGMRRTIAQRLTESARDIPHFPLNIDVGIDELLALRKELNQQAPEGVKISINDMLIRACALALKQVPEANASFTTEGIAYHHNADISVAVAIDGGLITPIIREAENKGLATISSEMKDLAKRARERKLQPHEFIGGTFSISNLGMMGIKSFGSIINPPQGMILSVGAGEKRPIIKDGAVSAATIMSLTLSCDHRVVDGAIGARWLAALKQMLQNPITMML